MKRASVKFFLAICFLILFSAQMQAQNSCVWISQTTPLALNLRLGMTTLEARAAVGKTPKISNKTKGDYRFFQNYIGKTPPPNLRDVRALYLRFFDGRLYQIEIFYEQAVTPSLENFAERVAQSYGFSVPGWTREKTGVVNRCGEYSLAADYVLNPRLELTNETVLKRANDSNKSKK